MATTHAATKSAERLYDAMVERTAMSVSILRNLGSSGGHGRGANAATQLASLLCHQSGLLPRLGDYGRYSRICAF